MRAESDRSRTSSHTRADRRSRTDDRTRNSRSSSGNRAQRLVPQVVGDEAVVARRNVRRRRPDPRLRGARWQRGRNRPAIPRSGDERLERPGCRARRLPLPGGSRASGWLIARLSAPMRSSSPLARMRGTESGGSLRPASTSCEPAGIWSARARALLPIPVRAAGGRRRERARTATTGWRARCRDGAGGCSRDPPRTSPARRTPAGRALRSCRARARRTRGTPEGSLSSAVTVSHAKGRSAPVVSWLSRVVLP